jgi:flagellar L-ring protein FlgH
VGVILLGMLHGCAWWQPSTTPVERDVLREESPPPPTHVTRSEGSLFDGANGHSLLFVGRTARHVNDIVTIRVIESASASGGATTETDRSSSAAASMSALFGFEKTLSKNGIDPASAIDVSLNHGFDGSGSTSRSNVLSATLTAIVREIFPNGNLYIEGKKQVLINHERQHIVLSGVIRPEDIRFDNSITSDLIADVRIAYSGSGVISDKQRPGWLGRALDVVWPF